MSMSTREYSCTGRAYILDTGALLAGIHLTLPCKSYTTSLVASEVIDEESRGSLERAVETRKLEIVDVDVDEDLRKLTSRGLSLSDVSIIALSLQLRNRGLEPLVFTDDYALQEELVKRGVEVRPVRYRGSKALRRSTRARWEVRGGGAQSSLR